MSEGKGREGGIQDDRQEDVHIYMYFLPSNEIKNTRK